jgi:O-antigen biosynthesis protein
VTSAPELSILVVAWNVKDHVLACLAAIFRDATRPALEVILVDNASGDGTVDAVAEQFPHVRIIANADNVGFPRANNQALAQARGRNILYLNPDTEVASGTLLRCMQELDAHPDVGVVGCRLEHPDGRIQYEGARNTYHFRHLAYELLYLHMLLPRSSTFGDHLMGGWDHRTTRDVEAVSGAFLMTRRELAVRLGGLPQDVFMYHEDLSFCLRVLRSGHRLRYLADVATVHYCGESSRKSSARFGLLEVESKLRYIEEADGAVWAVAARGVLAVRSLLRLAVCAVTAAAPGRWKRRHPRVFDWRMHVLQLYWCVARGRALQLAPGGEKWAQSGRATVEVTP